jgi:putative Mn2+ efflux pump MntP
MDPTSGNRGIDQSTAVRLGLKPVAMKIARPHEQLVVITSVVLLSSTFMMCLLGSHIGRKLMCCPKEASSILAGLMV